MSSTDVINCSRENHEFYVAESHVAVTLRTVPYVSKWTSSVKPHCGWSVKSVSKEKTRMGKRKIDKNKFDCCLVHQINSYMLFYIILAI